MKTTFTVLSFFNFLLIVTIPFSYAQPEVDIELYKEGFSIPVDIAHAGDKRLFIVEKGGLIKIIDENDNILPTPFLDITDRTVANASERGLLGLVFHPDYADNGYFFVNYTDQNGDTHIARFKVDPEDPNKALPDSEKQILFVEQPFNNHNGGDLNFGPDGYLYIGLGDGGSAGDPTNQAQNRQSLLGKMLRIDVNTPDENTPYLVPADNPFLDDSNTRDEIWALGLRNPWRFSFDAVTGDLWIGDVGQNRVEEVNFQAANSSGGENYGWRCYEGDQPFDTNGCEAQETYVPPIHTFNHLLDDGCGGSVTGGIVYRGNKYPGLYGYYIYADYCTGRIYAILQDQFGGWDNYDLLTLRNNEIVVIGEDQAGELYFATAISGELYKIKGQAVTSTHSAFELDEVNISPSPFNDQLTIQFQTKLTGAFTLRLLNAHGQEIWADQESFSSFFTKNIDTHNLPSGFYVLQLQTGKKIQSWKVLK